MSSSWGNALGRSGWIAVALILFFTATGIANLRGVKLDFANYYDIGHKALVGEFGNLYDPHAEIDGEPPFGTMAFLGAPMTAYLYAPLAMMDPKTATRVFKFAGAAAQLLAIFLLYRECRPLAGPRDEDRAAYFGLFAWAVLLFQPFLVPFQVGGQTTPFMFLFAVLAWMSYRRERLALAALLTACAVLLKPGLALAAVLLFLLSGNRFRAAAIAFGAVFGAVSLAVLGWDVHHAFLVELPDKSGEIHAPWMNSNPFGWVEALFVDKAAIESNLQRPESAALAGLVARLAGVALVLALLLRQMQAGVEGPARRHAVFVSAFIAALIFSPVVWSHYLMLVFIALAAMIALRRHLPAMAQRVLAGIIVVSWFQNFLVVSKLKHMLGFDTLPEILAIGILKSLPMLGLLVFLAVWRHAIRRALSDPAWRLLPGRIELAVRAEGAGAKV